ncbi:peptidoglycan-binding protein [Streptomyces sp. NPDC014864]|uniref:peptidoglycan-binding domain-containing protein n=1 Tax=Streptomyces sp. NPDC014864 TaxID=3364924 RepID=UPI0036FBDC89
MSTPRGGGQPHGGPPLEPVRVIRPRRTDALAELMREFQERRTGNLAGEGVRPGGGGAERGRSGDGSVEDAAVVEDATEELPPVPAGGPAPRGAPRTRPTAGEAGWFTRDSGPAARETGAAVRDAGPSAHGSGPGARDTGPVRPKKAAPVGRDAVPGAPGRGLRRAAVVVAVAAAALTGFGCALVLPGRGGAAGAAAAPSPHPSASVSTAPAPVPTAATGPHGGTDPDGPGTLREGDSGPEVAELQERLLRIPDVYRDGSIGGTYDAVLREAVARFQLWYGISGDETGVYGDDTRRSLESRTAVDGG